MKKRWKFVMCLLVICILAVVAVLYFRSKNVMPFRETEETVQIQAGIGETVEYVQLTAVRGNEITYLLAEVDETANTGIDEEEKSGDGRGNRTGGKTGRGGMTTDAGNGEMPDMSGMMPDMSGMMPDMSGMMPDMSGMIPDMSGMMPDMSGMIPDMSSGEMPDMSEMMSGMGSMFGNMFGGGTVQSQQTDDGTFAYGENTYRVTEAEVTELIPVGTDVTTKLGTVTTFSRLRAGDNVAIVRDSDSGEITAVYIIG